MPGDLFGSPGIVYIHGGGISACRLRHLCETIFQTLNVSLSLLGGRLVYVSYHRVFHLEENTAIKKINEVLFVFGWNSSET